MDKMYTIDDVQEIFGLKSKSTTYKLVNSDDFPKMKIGRAIRVHPKKLEEYIDKHSNDNIILN